MPKPTYKELWNKAKNLEKENQELKQAVAKLQADQQRKEIQASESSYQELIEGTNAIILKLDVRGNVQFINKFAQQFFGYTKQEILGKNVIGTIVPQTESSGRDLAAMIRDLGLHPDRYPSNENENIKKNGQKVWISWKNKGIRNDAGQILKIICVGNDITKRKRAERALQESESKFRSVTEQSPNMIFINKHGKVVYWNKRCEKIMGYSQAEFCSPNFDFFKLISPESMETVRSAFAKHQKGEEVEPYEYALTTKDGRKLDVIITTKLIQYEGDRAILGIVTDITQRKKMEESLKESETKFRALAELAPAAILIVAGEKFLYVNPAFETICGFAQKEALAMRFWEVVHPDMREFIKERGLARQRGQSIPQRYELKALTKDGQAKWIDVAATAIQYGAQTATLATAYDITERKLAEEELRKSQDKIARLKKMESLGLLAGGVAHDLNNVLSGIVSYPELLLLELPEGSNLKKPIETIQKAGHRAVAIVQDLLTVARGVATAKEPLSLNEIIRDYLKSPEYTKFKEYHPAVKLKTNLGTDLLNISGSSVHIRKVVMNLVSNAGEAIEDSGNIVISTVNRYIDKPLKGYDDVKTGEYAVLAVSDDGSGISSDDLERIFEPFYTKKVMGRSGTGLGLAVVWNVVRDHKGYIDVQSTAKGTTFELHFPITREAITDRESSLPIGDYEGAGETILVVDDVATQREIACNMLSVLGYKTTAVSSGEEAVKYLQAHTVDLILLDMIMDPGINGRETYERVIKIHPNQKAVIASGFAETDEVREAQKIGAGRFIKKPFTLEKIGFAVKDELKL